MDTSATTANEKLLTISSPVPPEIKDLEESFLNKLHTDGKTFNTIKNYKADLTVFNDFLRQPLIQKKVHSMVDVKENFIKDYDDYLAKKYTSVNSKRRKIQTLRIFFDYLCLIKKVLHNPAKGLTGQPKFLDIPRPVKFEDVKKLWWHLKSKENNDLSFIEEINNKRNQIIILLIYGCALKVSNLARLKFSHINAKRERVLIEELKRDPYTIPLPKAFNDYFLDYKDLLKKAKRRYKITFDDLLFNSNQYQILSGGLSPRGIEHIFTELRLELKIPLTPRELRQACIFKWLRFEQNESLIKEWLGVAPSYSLALYHKLLPEHPYDDEFLGLPLG